MIRLDSTRISVVAVCSCGWRSLTSTRPAAWRAAAAHELNAHPGENQAAAALHMHQIRHGDTP